MNRAVVRASPLFVRVGLTPRRVRGAPGPRRSRAPQTTQAASSRSRTSATLLPMVSAQEKVGGGAAAVWSRWDEPDGVRWWGPTQPAPALQRLVLSRRRRSLSKSVALLPVPGATSASLVARASPERGGAGQGGEVRTNRAGGAAGKVVGYERVAGRPSILRRKSAPPPPPGSPRVTSQPTP